MGVLPLQFLSGQNRESLGLTGQEIYRVENVAAAIACSTPARVHATREDGTEVTFEATVRIDTPQELEYYRNGGILPYVLRQVATTAARTGVAS
jgi:aconitate hydratase